MDDNSKENNNKDAGRVKILLLGQSAVGKSSLLAQYIDKDFSQGHMPTIGIQYKQKVMNLNNNKQVKIQIWDTAGHQRFRTITPVYYRNIDGALLVFDITNNESFQTINYWINELNDKADIQKIQMMLVGNKLDLQNERQVQFKHANQVADKIGIKYCQTSAKDYEKTKPAFDDLINRILKKKRKQFGGDQTIKLGVQTQSKKEEKKKQDCC